MHSAVLDHLWQSTLAALAIGLLVLSLRRAPAALRHGLWLAASLKFLIPFAGLAVLGRMLAPRLPAVVRELPVEAVQAAVSPRAALIEKAAEPLARFPLAPPMLQAPPSPAGTGPAAAEALHHHALPFDPVMLLLLVWAAGCAVVLVRWAVRSAWIARIVRGARPIAWAAPMPVRASASLMEPGLVGLLRPVLIVPETMPEHLSEPEIEAVLAHEISHLRRRDNLTAALHSLVEATFWFHPMVWWIGARLIVEREHACDEAVVRAGHDRRTYARSLVETARLYVQSPLSCVAGASGVDLKARVERIMTAPLTSPLSRTKKAVLLAAGACAVATPVTAGLLTPEGRKAVAPLARVMAVVAAPAHAIDLDQAEAPKPVVLARNDAILGPRIAVAATGARPLVVTQTLAAPHVEAPAQAARPVEVASISPAAAGAPARPVAPEPAPVDPREGAASFVRSYAAATARREVIARWLNPICVRVTGLADEQAAAVRLRIEDVARQLGVGVQPARCKRSDIQVGFTTDPQAVLDDVIKTKGRLLGDKTSGTEQVKTVTLPIQAWYQTNGKELAANDAGNLKALADYRGESWAGLKTEVLYQDTGITPSSNSGISNYSGCCTSYAPPTGPIGGWPGGPRQFQNVFVIVDLKRTGAMSLGLISDYVTMLVFSQPKSLGSCQALPSITDLFAACPGRPAPDGLTRADVTYLHALYGADRQVGPDFAADPAKVADVVDVMAPLLANAKVVAR